MRFRIVLLPVLVLLLLPIAVAVFDLRPAIAAAAIVVVILSMWAVSVGRLRASAAEPKLVLETTPASHFVEKVRWCLDRLGVDYVEISDVGTLGVFTLGRTLPRLRIRTGHVISRIGNSAHILRYLWGRYGADPRFDGAFLEPTPEAVELEYRCDQYGVHLQRWLYGCALGHPRFLVKMWGGHHPDVPRWQRLAIWVVYPLQGMLLRRAFRITPKGVEKSVAAIGELLAELDGKLADGRSSLLGGPVSFIDFTFAALSGLWFLPAGYGGGRADPCLPREDEIPSAFQADRTEWRQRYPHVAAHIMRLYQEERWPSG